MPTAAQIWRAYIVDGVSGSGNQKPVKSDIRAWGTAQEARASVAEAALGASAVKALSPASLVQPEVDVASATTTDIGAAASRNVRITGTTTITGLGTAAAGIERDVRFAGILTLTHNGTSLILPSAANIVTAAGDMLRAFSLGAGNWYIKYFTRASGLTLVGRAVQTKETIYRNAAVGITGTTSTTYGFPGAAATSSLMTWYFSYLLARQIIYARWLVAWTPKPAGAGGAVAGIKLIHADSGPANITTVGAAIEVNTPATPIVSTMVMTTELQALLNAGVDKFIGHQIRGDGTTGAIVYLSEMEIWWA